MKNKLLLILAAIGIVASTCGTFAADHGHLNVEAVGTSQNDALDFDNGALFDASTGYVFTLIYTNGGTYAGYYQGNITLTALAATAAHAGPVPGAPALGSLIFAQIVSVEGPPGGAFGFWDAGATSPTISIASGVTSTNLYRLSENDGSPGSDPYGHIHGRRFTATKPGLYAVAFRAFDLCTNGVAGWPIHSPSDILRIYFQAGVTITSLAKTNESVAVTFGARINRTYALQSTTGLGGQSGWTEASDVLLGTDYFATLVDTNATGEARFYRIKDITP